MSNIEIEKHGSGKFLCYQLEAGEQIDEFEYGMLRNNTIKGLIPLVVSSVDGNTVLKYDITEKMSLKELLNTEIRKKDFISFFKSLQMALQDMSDYMLKTDHVLALYDNIFVDKNSKEVGLVYVPVDSEEEELDIGLFLKNLIFQAKYYEKENNAYIFDIINFLNSNADFSYVEFGKVIDRLMDSGTENNDSKGVPPVKRPPVRTEKTDPDPSDISEEPKKDTRKSKKPFNFFEKKEEKGQKNPKKKKGSAPIGIKIPGKDMQMDRKSPIGEDIVKEDNGSENARLVYIKNNDVILLNKNHFRLGRKKDTVDYCIQGNNTVGRNHAEIIKNEMGYCIIDNDSKNHTYINGKGIVSGVPVVLKHEDRVTLSNEEFVFYLYEK